MKLLKIILILTKSAVSREEEKEIFNKPLTERVSEFNNIKNLTDPKRLIYEFKDEKDIQKILETIKICNRCLKVSGMVK